MKLFILLSLSTISCIIGWFMAQKEDERYKLSNFEKLTTLIVSVVSTLGICLKFQNPEMSIISWVVIAIGLLSTSLIVDFKLKELPDSLTFSCMGFIVPFIYFFYSKVGFSQIIPNIVILLGLEIFLYVLWRLTAKIGFGDLKLFIPVLLFVPYSWMVDYWINMLIFALVISVIELVRTKDRNIQIAFGPYIILGLISVYLGLSIFSVIAFV